MNRSEWQPSPDLWRKLKPVARQMRKEPTAAENRLWQRIRGNQVRGVKFRRQFAIDRFITDFCSPQVRLILEVDGPVHEYSQAEDALRTEVLETAGFEVLRFTNQEVFNNITAVVERIDQAVARKLEEIPPTP